MFKLMGKEINAILGAQMLFIWTNFGSFKPFMPYGIFCLAIELFYF